MTTAPPFALRARTAKEPEPDLTSIVVIHRAIRQDLARLAACLGQVAAHGAPRSRPPSGGTPRHCWRRSGPTTRTRMRSSRPGPGPPPQARWWRSQARRAAARAPSSAWSPASTGHRRPDPSRLCHAIPP